MNSIFKQIYSHAWLLLACFLAVSGLAGCDQESLMQGNDAAGKSGVISIRLNSGNISTRAEEGIYALNENKIESAILCFYPSYNPNGTPAFVEYWENPDADLQTKTVVAEVALERDVKDALFPVGTDECQLYVIANPPADMVKVTESMKLDDIKKLSINADFASKNVQPSFTMDGTTEGGNPIKISNRGSVEERADGYVKLQRCASKITLAVAIDEEITTTDLEGNEQVWRARTGTMDVVITDGVRQSEISSMSYVPQQDDYYSTSATYGSASPYSERRLSPITPVSIGEYEYDYGLASPFYTFPTEWVENDADSRKLFMTLMVQFEHDTETGQEVRTCYYTVPAIPVIEGVESRIGRNMSYRVYLHVNMLGSFTPDEEVDVNNLSYYAVEWGSVETDVTLADSRYLVVDQTEYELNNEAAINIPVYTSHETVVTARTMEYYLYNVTPRGLETPVYIGAQRPTNYDVLAPQYQALCNSYVPENSVHTLAAANNSSYVNTVLNSNGTNYIYTANFVNANEEIGESSNYLAYNHPLYTWTPHRSGGGDIELPQDTDNAATAQLNAINYYTPTTSSAYSMYVTYITIAHKDKPEQHHQTITIRQYPGMYIDATLNYFVNGSLGNGMQGNTYVNSNQYQYLDNDANNGTIAYWYRVQSNTAGTNLTSNPNQYVISITQLSSEEGSGVYHIDDPRQSESTTLYGWRTWTSTSDGITTTHYFGDPELTSINATWATAPDMDGTARQLEYYYPTDRSVEKARYMAPTLRIASSYGAAVAQLTYNMAMARCAGYQELGYPAGRWRIPTVAEVEFIMKLSLDKKIPNLFNTSAGRKYFSAQGLVYTDDLYKPGSTGLSTPESIDYDNDIASVRCVYDEWYWNDTVEATNNVYPFTWGDRKR